MNGSPMIRHLPDLLVEPVVRMALAEDLGRGGDITAQACIPEGARMRAVFAARKPGVLAGIGCVRLSLLAMDPAATIRSRLRDGDAFEAGAVLVEAEADARAFLAAERTALNLLGRLCGIATLTRAYVETVAGTDARIADTRKTTPGLRALEKHAVVCGGVAEAIRRARAAAGHLVKVEIEVDGLDQLDEALAERPDVVMLDNFTPDMLREAVARVRDRPGRPVLEASGGVNLQTVRGIAEAGVDVISVGALTHSAASLDIGLDAV